MYLSIDALFHRHACPKPPIRSLPTHKSSIDPLHTIVGGKKQTETFARMLSNLHVSGKNKDKPTDVDIK